MKGRNARVVRADAVRTEAHDTTFLVLQPYPMTKSKNGHLTEQFQMAGQIRAPIKGKPVGMGYDEALRQTSCEMNPV